MPLLFLSPLHKATRQIALHFERGARGGEISPLEGHILSYLRSYAPCPVGELKRVFGTKRSTLTSVLDRLEARGHLIRTTHETDRRSFLVTLTRAGKTAANGVQAQVDALEAAIGEQVTKRDLEGFQRVMDAVAKATGVQVRPSRKESKS